MLPLLLLAASIATTLGALPSTVTPVLTSGGSNLVSGNTFYSPNGCFQFRVQGDGNLASYCANTGDIKQDSSGTVYCASNTQQGNGIQVWLTNTGVLTIADGGYNVQKTYGTAGPAGVYTLAITNDGDWQTFNSQGVVTMSGLCWGGWGGCNSYYNGCDGTPCGSSGTCSLLFKGHTCSCSAAGLCQASLATSSCLPNPCQNGGACLPTNGNYTCSCPAGFSGTLCEIDVSQSVCSNHGVAQGSFAAGFLGKYYAPSSGYGAQSPSVPYPDATTSPTFTRLETTLNYTASRNSPGGGISSSFYATFEGFFQVPNTTLYTFTVTADDGVHLIIGGKTVVDMWLWTATQTYSATVNLTAGITYPIRLEYFQGEGDWGLQLKMPSGVTPFTTSPQPNCTCAAGFSGTTCQNDYTGCLATPCLHSGVCTPVLGGTYTCTCPTGYNGTRCQNDLNPCRVNAALCQNGGTCSSENLGKYTCACTTNFNGTNCETSSPAESGGLSTTTIIIIAAVAGGVALLFLILILIIVIAKKKRGNKTTGKSKEDVPLAAAEAASSSGTARTHSTSNASQGVESKPRTATLVPDNPEYPYDFFISYRQRSDKGVSEKIYLTLRALQIFGRPVIPFMDIYNLAPGEDWEQGFVEGLKGSKVLVPVVSRNGLENIRNLQPGMRDNVLYEYEMAIEEKETRGVVVFPLLVGAIGADGSIMPFRDFSSQFYPDHISETCTKRTIRQTMEKFFKLQGFSLNNPESSSEIRHVVEDILRQAQSPPPKNRDSRAPQDH